MTLHVRFPGFLRGARGWVGCVLLASASLAAANTSGDDRQGTFKAVEGEVTIIGGEARRAATVGGPLREAERVETGAKSAAAVTLVDGTVITMGPGTVLDVKRVQYDSTTQGGNMLIDLLRGSLRVVTGLIAKTKPENMQVTTPTSVIGVRGTDFIVEANP